MADSIVRLTVEDSSFNAKIKAAAKSFADFGKNVASAGVDAFRKFASGAETAKVAFQGFNAALKANALVFVITTAIQAGQAIGEMIGDWISGASDAEDAQKKLNEEVERTLDLLHQMDEESDFNAKMAKAMGKSTSEILQIKKASAIERMTAAQAAVLALPKSAVGSEEWEKLNKEAEKYEKLVQKINNDITLDITAKQYKTGEYAVRGGGGGRGGRSGSTTQKEQTEMQTLQTKTKELEQEYIKLGNVSTEAANKRRTEIRQEIADNEKRIGQIKLLNEQAHGRLLGGDLQTTGLGKASLTGGIPEIGKGLEVLPQHLSPLQQMNAELSRMRELLELAPNTEAYQAALQKIIDKEKEIKQWKGETDTEDVAKNSANAWRGAASAMSSVSSALSQMEDPGAKIMGIIGEAIANIASGFAAASAGEGKSGNIWYWIAATAAGLATMVSTIATIHSATGFAEGGIVKGNTYSSDQIPARLNAGEVVLTHAMAGNLAQQLEGNGLGNLNLSATISGEQIRLVLNNNGRRTGVGEYVTTNFR